MIDSQYQVQTPVAVIFFNRSQPVEAVMRRVREARPRQLFLIADGPRADVPGDVERCAETRATVEAMLDWECEVHRHYADRNLGCGPRPASGISWVFEHVEEAIILEDDCVPETSFFRFCDEMLDLYRDRPEVFQICGTNYYPEVEPTPYSYHFSRYLVCWGWATWRRAWQHFDYSMRDYEPERATAMLQENFERDTSVRYWRRQFDRLLAGDDSVWDLRWLYAGWRNNALSVIPAENLVTNVGFGGDSTHTTDAQEGGFQPTGSLSFPLAHPPTVSRHREWDRITEDRHFKKPTPWQHIKAGIKHVLPDPMVVYLRNTLCEREAPQLRQQAS